MFGLARSNSGSSWATTSPSRPMAQKRRTVSRADHEPQPVASVSVATRARRTALLTGTGEPTTREAGLLEAPTQVRVLAHHAPDERATVVLDHRQDHALIDAEVVAGDPAELRHALAVSQRNVEGERSVERVEEAVPRVDVLAEAAVHFERGRDDELRRERHRRDDGGRRQRAVVMSAGGIDAARHVAAEAVAPGGVLDLDVGGPIARGDAPDGLAVIAAPARIHHGIGSLSVNGASAVLKVVDPALLHVRIANVAQIRPHVRVLMTEQRRKVQILLAEERAPLLVVRARPFGPRVEPDRERR